MKAGSLEPLLILSLVLTAGCLSLPSNGNGGTVPDESTVESGENTSINVSMLENELLVEINDERADDGLNKLQSVDYLNYTASVQSELMGEKGYIAHEYNQSEFIFANQMDKWNINCGNGYENLAYYEPSYEKMGNLSRLADSIVTNWQLSDEHRRAMLSSELTVHGIGVYVDSTEIYATHHMCER